jgi:hypothetical protein
LIKLSKLNLFVKDESMLESTDDEQLNELNKQLWNEEYFPVASRLYQRLIDENKYFQTNELNNHS